jgi:tRNA-specific 2-thiouridylase
MRGSDQAKDQSYFLYRMTSGQLENTLFPLGDLTKPEVRAIARKLGLPAAERPESQETCFVANDDVRGFVRARRPEAFRPGPVVDGAGRVVGAHDGVSGITVGQRRGLGLSGSDRVFVSAIDAGSATVTVGPREALACSKVLAGDVVWRGSEGPLRVSARVRYRGPEPAGEARRSAAGLEIRFDEAVDAPAPGQAIVCYDGSRVIGGGVIQEAS